MARQNPLAGTLHGLYFFSSFFFLFWTIFSRFFLPVVCFFKVCLETKSGEEVHEQFFEFRRWRARKGMR
jgi:hypothetical protein